jgi:Holliday junction resolvasome RuvABC endonuclease subunit
MKIMALDPATTMGYAIGRHDAIPRSGSVRLKRPAEHRNVAPFNAMCFLRDQWVLDRPDLVVVEHFLNPVAQKSADAVILQIMVYGVIVAMCQRYGIRIEEPGRSTILKHFIGRANMGDRESTKQAVLRRAKLLKYMPAESFDKDRADACAVFDFGAATYARFQSKTLVLFDS